MNPARRESAKRLFHDALERPAAERDAFVREAAAGDEELRDEVRALLTAHTKADAAFGEVVRPAPSGSAAHALPTGTRLGPYEIDRLIGAGGMGEVYRARDTRLDRTVAIKVLPALAAGDAQARERFEREARAVSSLNHPHICTLHDIGHHEGIDFLVMEHLEGETLATRLTKGPLPIAQALQIGIQIASALDRAHRAGIVHRDLKPGNIFLVRGGGSAAPAAKLLDFGLAKSSAPAVATAATRVALAPDLTTPGMILGTVQYMAPEQVEGKEADARSDIWALGAVLYEMATGTRPFAGDTPASVIGAILKDEPPPISARQPLAPTTLDRLVSVCLAKDPEQRWQSARDLMTELRWTAEAAPTAAALKARRNLWPWIAVASVCLAAAGLAIRLFLEPPNASEPVQFIVMPPEGGTFSGDGLAGSNPPGPQLALAPDGRRLAFIASTSDGRPRLWVRSLDSVMAQPLRGTEGAARPFWSPDGRFIGFFAGAKLKTISADGGPVQVLCDVSSPRGGTWSQDGVIIFSPSFGDGLYRVSVAGDRPTPVTRIDTARQEISHRWPQFLPDGRHFLFLALNARRDQSGIYLGALDSADTVRILDTEFHAEFAMPGYLFFVREGTLLAQPFDQTTSRVTGDAVSIGEHVGSGQATGEAPFSTAPGAIAYTFSNVPPPTQLTWVDRAGQPRGTIGPRGEYENAVLSADNQRVAVHRVDPVLGTDVWLMDSVHGSPSRYTFDPAIDFAPIWSPDGRHIAFSSNRTGTFAMYQKLVTGGGEQLLFDTKGNGMFLTCWSADGKYLVYTQAGSKTGFDVWVVPLFGDRKPVPLLQSISNEGQGQLTTDGQLIAYTSDESGTPEVFVQPFPSTGAKWQVSIGGGSDPQWRRDGQELFYVSPDGTLMAVQVKRGPPTFDIGVTQALFQTRRGVARGPLLFSNYAPAADGQRFLVNAMAAEVPPMPITVTLNWAKQLKK